MISSRHHRYWPVATLVVLIVTAALALNRPAFIGSKTVIRFWHGFTSKDGEAMLQLVRDFNAANPGVEVQVQRIPWGTYYNKLFVAGLAGRAPEVFISHTTMLSRLERGKFLQPVDDLIANSGATLAHDFDANIWSAVEVEGRHLGIPLDVHPLGLFYNRRLLTEAGLVDAQGAPRPPANWPEFVAAITKLNRDVDGDGRNDQWGFMFEGTPFIAAYTFMLQEGGCILSPDGTQARIDTPENIAGLKKLRQLTVEMKLVPKPGDETAWTSFLQGRVGLFLGGVFMIGALERQSSIDYAVAPVPQFGPEARIWGDSHVLCLPRIPDGKRAEAAWQFIRYLSDHGVAWARGGQVPARISQRQSPEFRAMTAQAVFAGSVEAVRYLPNVPATAAIVRDVRFACEEVLRGGAQPEEALAKAQSAVEATLARDRETAAAIRLLEASKL